MAIELQDKHVYVSEETLRKHMGEELSKIGNADSSDPNKSTIYKVPNSLRHGCPGDYEPELISIGPLHRLRPELRQMDRLKWTYLNGLLNRHGVTVQLDQFVEAMWQVEEDVRKQYSVDINMEAGELVEVLVLDGCFLIELFLKLWCESDMWNLYMLRRDLLLLENQIPFSVLDTLFNLAYPQGFSHDQDTESHTLLSLALHYISGRKTKVSGFGENGSIIHHILHLNHKFQLLRADTGQIQNPACNTVLHLSKKLVRGFKKITWESSVTCFFFFVSLILMCKCPRCHTSPRAEFPREMPSAKNLKEGGIHFKRKRDTCYLNLSFNEESGNLEIPFLYLRPSTICILRNLIAWEHCWGDNQCCFTTYAYFMHGIITTEEDVKILVRDGILEHKLGTDGDVANIFNDLCNKTPAIVRSILRNENGRFYHLFKRVNKYCDSEQHRWRAALVDNYLYSPWAVASVVTAVILLLLTLISTIASVWRTVHVK